MLMTLSNQESALVLTTGNKSEIAMGYCTLYGDTVGALAPIGDLFKTRVYELAWHLYRTRGFLPKRSLTKAPSAELRPNQRDDQSLPPYDQLDPLLEDYLENGWSAEKLLKKYDLDSSFLRTLLRQIERNEYKRRQFAPAFKVTSAAFGIGRKIPISKVWN
jgi:NAD+ synthase (glutamine-hydrolysing)